MAVTPLHRLITCSPLPEIRKNGRDKREMMKQTIKYYLISGMIVFSPLLGLGNGIGPTPLQNVLETHFGRTEATPEPVRDQELVDTLLEIESCEAKLEWVDEDFLSENPYVADKYPGYRIVPEWQGWDVHSNSYGPLSVKDKTVIQMLKDTARWTGQSYEERVAIMKNRDLIHDIAYEWTVENRHRLSHWSCYKLI